MRSSITLVTDCDDAIKRTPQITTAAAFSHPEQLRQQGRPSPPFLTPPTSRVPTFSPYVNRHFFPVHCRGNDRPEVCSPYAFYTAKAGPLPSENLQRLKIGTTSATLRIVHAPTRSPSFFQGLQDAVACVLV
ncbi:hypothetical protein GALMADRAFT_281042 [Galerina marginata CBS 339.88]|uniref:Uncharacterized protein n=1 Tax=Galerina marginata (strain CBS 339.88) TaxID=685588 RepID=A0A067SR08_GALM3|nr:hypothetical protein GALMADRAFT_281042 [Galerina marginata CBS 339.88]